MLTEQEYYMTYDEGKWTAYDIPVAWAKTIYTEPRVLYGGPPGQDFTGYKIWVKPKTSNMTYKYQTMDKYDSYGNIIGLGSYSWLTGHFQPFMTAHGPATEDYASVWYWKEMSIYEVVDLYKDRMYAIMQKPKFVPGKNCLF